MLVPMRILLDHAAENGYGLAALNVLVRHIHDRYRRSELYTRGATAITETDAEAQGEEAGDA